MGIKLGNVAALILAVSILFTGCKKEEEPGIDQKADDHEKIEQYVAENNLDGQFTESGLYYVINEPGNNDHPDLNSVITVSYKGYYINGDLLDSGNFFTSKLSNLIEGWKEGIPLIGTAGKIKLILPSHLGYGNGIIIFDVTLHYFSK